MTTYRPLPNALPPLLAALAIVSVALAGCTAGTKGAKGIDLSDDDTGPVLYLNVTVGNQTYRYSTADPGGSGGDGSASGTVSGSVTPGGNGTVQGNATSGSSTAQGNASAGSGSATATGTYGNGTGGSNGGGMGLPGGGMPSGPAPLDVRVEIGASDLPGDLPVDWTFAWGDAAATQGNGTSANATASPGAAPQQAREQGSALPATLTHTFASAGHYQVAFGLKVKGATDKVADQASQKAGEGVKTLRAAVQVTGSVPNGPAPGSFLGNQTDAFDGSALAAAPPFCGVLDTFKWKLNETFGGSPSVVQRILVNATSDGTGDVTLTLRDGNGTELASGGSIDEQGTFPPATYTIDVEACPAANLDYEVTAVGMHFAK